jgi:hypothetical protein
MRENGRPKAVRGVAEIFLDALALDDEPNPLHRDLHQADIGGTRSWWLTQKLATHLPYLCSAMLMWERAGTAGATGVVDEKWRMKTLAVRLLSQPQRDAQPSEDVTGTQIGTKSPGAHSYKAIHRP